MVKNDTQVEISYFHVLPFVPLDEEMCCHFVWSQDNIGNYWGNCCHNTICAKKDYEPTIFPEFSWKSSRWYSITDKVSTKF